MADNTANNAAPPRPGTPGTEAPVDRNILPDPVPAEPLQPPSGPRSDTDFAIVVGIDHYPPPKELNGAISDAEAFSTWLCNPRGGGLDPDNVTLLRSGASGALMQSDIDRVLKRILVAAKATGRARRLYFYFAGHGAGNRQSYDDVALLLTWSPAGSRVALSTEGYSNQLRNRGVFKEVVLFIDCCRSTRDPAVGVAPELEHGDEATVAATNLVVMDTKKFTAYATTVGKPAFELPWPDRWHGLFSRCLMAIFRRTLSTGVSAADLKRKIINDVKTMAKWNKLDQCPDVHEDLDPESHFGQREQRSRGARASLLQRIPVLRRWLTSEPLHQLELWFAGRRGKVVLRRAERGGRLGLVAKRRVSDKPWRLRLPVGIYVVEDGRQTRVCFWHNGQRARHDV